MECEANLLQDLLEALTSTQAFQMGKVMGIMRKGDAIYIEKLLMHITDLEGIIAEQKALLGANGVRMKEE